MNLFPFLDHNAEKHRTENRRVVSRRRRRVWNCESPEWNLCFFFFSWTTSAYQDGLLGGKNKALRHSHGNALEAAERSFRFWIISRQVQKSPAFTGFCQQTQRKNGFSVEHLPVFTRVRLFDSGTSDVLQAHGRLTARTDSEDSRLDSERESVWDNDWGEVHAVLMWWSHWKCFCQNQVLVWNKLNDSEVKSETMFSLILMY